MRGLVAFILAGVAGLWLAATAFAQDRMDAAGAGTVRVVARSSPETGGGTISLGTGFVVAPRLIVTNAHVVSPGRGPGGTVSIVAPGGDGAVPGRIVAFSTESDLALIEVGTARGLAPLTLSVAEPRPGEAIVALGYPDVDDIQRSADQILAPTPPSRTTGTIASLRDTAPTGADIPTINHAAEISSGSSGGPLMDECGRVLGVNTWHARAQDTLESRSVAIRSAYLLDFLADAGVRPPTSAARCPTLMERLESERADTIEALQAQNRRLAEQIAAAERLSRVAVAILAGGTLALLVAVVVLGAIVFGRHHHSEPHEAQGASSPLRRGGRSVLVVVAGATIAGVLIVSAGVALWRTLAPMRDAAGPGVFAGEVACVLDRARSYGAGDETEARFSVDGGMCVNGRTPYVGGRRGSGVFERLSLDPTTRSLDAFVLDATEGVFSRSTYRLSDDDFDRAQRAINDIPPSGCDREGQSAQRRRNQSLARYAEGEASQRRVFRCIPAPAG